MQATLDFKVFGYEFICSSIDLITFMELKFFNDFISIFGNKFLQYWSMRLVKGFVFFQDFIHTLNSIDDKLRVLLLHKINTGLYDFEVEQDLKLVLHSNQNCVFQNNKRFFGNFS